MNNRLLKPRSLFNTSQKWFFFFWFEIIFNYILVHDFNKFAKEVNLRQKIKSGGDCEKFKEKCLTTVEKQKKAYRLSIKFSKKIGRARFFFNSAKITNESNGYSKFLLSLSTNNGNQAFLFK